MKRITMITCASILLTVACKKKDPVSIEVTVPKMELIGPSVITMTPTSGGSFTDPGVRFTDETGSVSTLNTPSTTNVDLSTPGFYYVSYLRNTEHGYTVKIYRNILVTTVPATEDFSGIYVRTANGVAIELVKIDTGVYSTDDVGGNGGSFSSYIGKINDSVLVIPPQISEAVGEFSGSDGKLTISGADTIIQWRLAATGYGTGLRTFVK